MQAALNSPATVRIVVADDHPIFREGLIRLLDTRPDLQVVAAASDGDEALPLVLGLAPDVLVLDLAMPRVGGLATLRQMSGAKMGTKVLILTAAIERPEM